jgi:hypothetical protein
MAGIARENLNRIFADWKAPQTDQPDIRLLLS